MRELDWVLRTEGLNQLGIRGKVQPKAGTREGSRSDAPGRRCPVDRLPPRRESIPAHREGATRPQRHPADGVHVLGDARGVLTARSLTSAPAITTYLRRHFRVQAIQ
jgi:hypothetical protein